MKDVEKYTRALELFQNGFVAYWVWMENGAVCAKTAPVWFTA